MNEDEAFASFWGHLEELRRILLRIFLIILISVIACFICYEPLLTLLKYPLNSAQTTSLKEERLEYRRIYNSDKTPKHFILPENSILSLDLSTTIEPSGKNGYLIAPQGTLVFAKMSPTTHELVILGPLEGILIALKTSFWMGIFISSPLWLFVLSQFFIPGLHIHERHLMIPFLLTSFAFIISGCFFAYCITIPLANQYLLNFNDSIGINLWSVGNYLDYTLFLLMANGIAFELGAIGIFAVHLQLVSAQGLIANRRFAILGAFIMATVLTPPDVLTQFMLAIPLCVLYEALILYARLKAKIKNAI